MGKSNNSNALGLDELTGGINAGEHRHQESFEDPNLDLGALGQAGAPNNVAPLHAKPAAAPNASGATGSTGWTPKASAPVDDVRLLHQERVQMLHQLNSLILQAIPFEQLVGFSLSVVTAAVKGTVASVLELDQRSQEFFFRASTGGSAERLSDIRIPASEGIAGYVASHRSVELISNANEDRRHMAAISRLAGKELSNCIAAPIQINGNIFGVLEVFNKADGSAFTVDDKATVEMALPIISKILEVRFFAAEVMR